MAVTLPPSRPLTRESGLILDAEFGIGDTKHAASDHALGLQRVHVVAARVVARLSALLAEFYFA